MFFGVHGEAAGDQATAAEVMGKVSTKLKDKAAIGLEQARLEDFAVLMLYSSSREWASLFVSRPHGGLFGRGRAWQGGLVCSRSVVFLSFGKVGLSAEARWEAAKWY